MCGRCNNRIVGIGRDSKCSTSSPLSYSPDILPPIFIILNMAQPDSAVCHNLATGPARPLCLVEHPGSRVLDLGFALEAALDAAAVRARHRAAANDEYAEIEVVALPNLPGFMAREAATMNLQAPIFLSRAGLLP